MGFLSSPGFLTKLSKDVGALLEDKACQVQEASRGSFHGAKPRLTSLASWFSSIEKKESSGRET
jgi:hypothetical protein